MRFARRRKRGSPRGKAPRSDDAAGCAVPDRPECRGPGSGGQPAAAVFREDWKEIAAVTPVTQEHVANPKLLVALYGPGKDGIRKSHHDAPKDDPYYIWLGSCPANCAIALRDKDGFVDLTGLAKIRWRTKQTGFRSVRLTLKLEQWHLAGERLCGRSVGGLARERVLDCGDSLATNGHQDHRRRPVGGESRPEPGR